MFCISGIVGVHCWWPQSLRVQFPETKLTYRNVPSIWALLFGFHCDRYCLSARLVFVIPQLTQLSESYDDSSPFLAPLNQHKFKKTKSRPGRLTSSQSANNRGAYNMQTATSNHHINDAMLFGQSVVHSQTSLQPGSTTW